uniref:Uncharacterized protein n=1 Tax=Arundo donax TaxID=35708 RepID=A0A0A9GIK4_ARUDO
MFDNHVLSVITTEIGLYIFVSLQTIAFPPYELSVLLVSISNIPLLRFKSIAGSRSPVHLMLCMLATGGQNLWNDENL